MAAGRLVGTPVLRREDARLLLGQARFVADIEAPRMLHMAVSRSPVAHAALDRVIVDAAKAVPGVRLVLTGEDVAAYGKLPRSTLPVRATPPASACWRSIACALPASRSRW